MIWIRVSQKSLITCTFKNSQETKTQLLQREVSLVNFIYNSFQNCYFYTNFTFLQAIYTKAVKCVNVYFNHICWESLASNMYVGDGIGQLVAKTWVPSLFNFYFWAFTSSFLSARYKLVTVRKLCVRIQWCLFGGSIGWLYALVQQMFQNSSMWLA